MLRFTRRQYEGLLRRAGLDKSGLEFDDTPRLVTVLDFLGRLLPEPPVRRAYFYQNINATVGEYWTIELTAPPNGMYIERVQIFGAAGNWGWGINQGASLIATPSVAATFRQVRSDVGDAVATLAAGTAVAPVQSFWVEERTNTDNLIQLDPPLFVPSGRVFLMQQLTANDAAQGRILWSEPGP